MSEFVKEGYFLRGGVDVGWFVENPDIAVGMPLVNAYKLETEKAIHPRIMLSDNFQKIAYEYLAAGKLNDANSFLIDKYIKQSTEKESSGMFFWKETTNYFLNPFFYIINFEEKGSKIQYLKTYNEKIKEQLKLNDNNKNIRSKYRWFLKEYNSFIDAYTNNEAYKELDSDELEYSKDEIELIQALKI